MRKLFLFIFFILFKFVFPQVFNEPVFHQIEPEKLGVNKAWNQLWDKNGSMWAASDKGLICYNGYSTKKWPGITGDSSTILSNEIQTMMLDSKNNLWISYLNIMGISKFNTLTGKIKHFLPASNLKNSVPNYAISSFKEDSKGRMWLLTWGGGLCKIDAESGICKTYLPHKLSDDLKLRKGQQGKSNRVKAMLEMPDGRFLMGFFTSEESENYPLYFDPVKETFEPFPVMDYVKSASPALKDKILLSLKIVHFIYKDKLNDFWFGTYCGLIHLDVKNKTASRISGQKDVENVLNLDNTRNFVEDDNNILWIGTPNAGLMLVDIKTKAVNYLKHDPKVSSSIADNRIRTMKKDPNGNIWISTEEGGLSIYNSLVQQFNVAAWKDMGIDYSNRSEQRIPVNQMLVQKNGWVYISSETGLSIFNPSSQTIIKHIDPQIKLNTEKTKENINSRVLDFKFLDDEHILMISPYFPVIYDLKKEAFNRTKIRDTSIKNFAGSLLFRHSLKKTPVIVFRKWKPEMFVLDTSKNEMNRYYHFNTKKDMKENYSYILNSGKWLLSFGEKEFAIFDPVNKKYDMYGANHKDHFFPDSTIRIAYLDKNGMVWFATGTGLYKFDEATGKSEYMNPKIGLAKESVNAIINPEDDIWWFALDKQLLRWDSKNNTTFRVGRELGLQAGSFLGAIAQKDNEGKIYMATINGVLIFDPAKIKVPEQNPTLRLSNLIIKEDTLSNERIDDFAKGNTNLKWNDNFLNLEFATNEVYSPVPNHFFYRLIGLDSVWQNNETSNRLRYPNLAHGSYTLEVKVKNGYELTSNTLRIPFKIKTPFWLTWWFYCTVFAILIFSVYSFIKYREKAFIKQQVILEQRIKERTAEVVAKAEEINIQKDIILEKNKELTDSIYYAQRIQQSILPEEKQMIIGLPKHFIFFMPKDIVSGDFFWYSKQKDSVLWAVVDCTGHGVPGGFMSMLGSGLLNQIVNEELKLNPGEVLNNLRDRVIIALKQTGAYGESKDGMDITLCRWIQKENKLQVSAANNPLYIVRNKELIEIKADKQPIGIYVGEQKTFTTHEIALQKGDKIYMTSDGYADQFGGPKGKKFKTSNLEKLLLQSSSQLLDEQLLILKNTFDSWKEGYDQLDDVCVMGVEV